MTHGRNPLHNGLVLLQSALSTVSQAYAWTASAVLTIVVVLALLDIVLSAFGIYIESIPLLVSLPIFQTGTAWLLANLSAGFSIHHLLRPDTRLDLAFLWGLGLLSSTLFYWH